MNYAKLCSLSTILCAAAPVFSATSLVLVSGFSPLVHTLLFSLPFLSSVSVLVLHASRVRHG
jgi:hypothetical protein